MIVFVLILHQVVLSQGISIRSGATFRVTGSPVIMIQNGNWSNGGNYFSDSETVKFSGTTAATVSGSSTDFYDVIAGNSGGVTQQSSLVSCHNLTITTGCNYTIGPKKALTVDNTLENNAGSNGLLLKSDTTGTASLLHNSDNVPATVERYISGQSEAWHLLSSPVSGQEISGSWTPGGTYANGTGYDLYVWYEPADCWIYNLNLTSAVNWNTVHPQEDFVPGLGYLYSFQELNPVKKFAGALNNGSVSSNLNVTTTSLGYKGFNLAGNPYPSAVDWQSSSGWERGSLTETNGGYDMWIWNDDALNYGVINSSGGSGTNGVTRYIPPMQGFFVLASEQGSLVMNNDARVHETNAAWLKDVSLQPKEIGITVSSEPGRGYDEVKLKLGYQAGERGSYKIFSQVTTAPSLYLTAGSENYSVACFSDPTTVPFNFKGGRSGVFTLSFTQEQGDFDTLYLEDKKVGFMQDLLTNPIYSFAASEGDDPERFVLHFGAVASQPGGRLPAVVSAGNGRLMADLSNVEGETILEVFDVSGRKIYSTKLAGKSVFEMPIHIASQIVIVRLTNPNGYLNTKLYYDKN